MVELLCQHNADPSAGLGWPLNTVHHVAYFASSLDAETARQRALGVDVAMTALAGQRFTFFDTVAMLGHFLECYEPTPRLVGFYDTVRGASVGWDGSDSVREL